MTRNEAIQKLHVHYGTTKTSAVDLVNKLQEDAKISDNVVEPRETATCDLVAAAEGLTRNQPLR